MNNLFQDKAFKLGFLISIFFTVGGNLVILKLIAGSRCNGCFGKRSIGFPFKFYEELHIARQATVEILWLGLAADLLFALLISVLIGLLFSSIWKRFSPLPLD